MVSTTQPMNDGTDPYREPAPGEPPEQTCVQCNSPVRWGRICTAQGLKPEFRLIMCAPYSPWLRKALEESARRRNEVS